MKLFMLSYDTDYGDREEWNTFYTPVEAFSTEKKRENRIAELKNAVDDDGDPRGYEFHKYEVEVDEHA